MLNARDQKCTFGSQMQFPYVLPATLLLSAWSPDGHLCVVTRKINSTGITQDTDFIFVLLKQFNLVVLRDVLLCKVVIRYQRFGGPCCFHLHGEDFVYCTSLWRWRQQGSPKRWCLLNHYTVSQASRPRLQSWPPWRHQIWNFVRNFFPEPNGRAHIEDVWEQGAEENIWT